MPSKINPEIMNWFDTHQNISKLLILLIIIILLSPVCFFVADIKSNSRKLVLCHLQNGQKVLATNGSIEKNFFSDGYTIRSTDGKLYAGQLGVIFEVVTE